MAIIILVLSIVVCIFSWSKANRLAEYDRDAYAEDGAIVVAIISAVVGVGAAMFIIFSLSDLKEIETIKKNIETYEKDNKVIKQELILTAKEYNPKVEDQIFEFYDTEFIINLYPELGSNAFVREKIKQYNENEQEISSLEKEMDKHKDVIWFAFFG